MFFLDRLYVHQLNYSQIETNRFIPSETDKIELDMANRNCFIRHDPIIFDVGKSSVFVSNIIYDTLYVIVQKYF